MYSIPKCLNKDPNTDDLFTISQKVNCLKFDFFSVLISKYIQMHITITKDDPLSLLIESSQPAIQSHLFHTHITHTFQIQQNSQQHKIILTLCKHTTNWWKMERQREREETVYQNTCHFFYPTYPYNGNPTEAGGWQHTQPTFKCDEGGDIHYRMSGENTISLVAVI